MKERTCFSIPLEFFHSKTNKDIKSLGSDSQLLAYIMMLNPMITNKFGVYYLPISQIVEYSGLKKSKVIKSIEELISVGFCDYDYEEQFVWVKPVMGFSELNSHETSGEFRIFYKILPNLCFLEEFFRSFDELYETFDFRCNSERIGPPQRKKRDANKVTIQTKSGQTGPKRGRPRKGIVVDSTSKENLQVAVESCKEVEEKVCATIDEREVFEYWRLKIREGSSAKMDNKRRNKIKLALKMYSKEDLLDAIDGCALSDFHMGRAAESTTRHDDITLILRDSSHIERFISIKREPHKYGNKSQIINFERKLRNEEFASILD